MAIGSEPSRPGTWGPSSRFAGRYDEGLALLETALDVHQLRPTEDPLQYGRCYADAGACMKVLGQLAEAEDAFVRGIALLERAGDPGKPLLARARSALQELRGGG